MNKDYIELMRAVTFTISRAHNVDELRACLLAIVVKEMGRLTEDEHERILPSVVRIWPDGATLDKNWYMDLSAVAQGE